MNLKTCEILTSKLFYLFIFDHLGYWKAFLFIIADIPFAKISTDSKGVFGSMTIFKSEITSCPKLEGVEWQGSSDGKKFFRIDISKPHFHGSKQLAESPLLVISKTTFEDRLHYRLCVRNKIGRTFSNILYLDVKGSMYQYFNEWSITVNIISLNWIPILLRCKTLILLGAREKYFHGFY